MIKPKLGTCCKSQLKQNLRIAEQVLREFKQEYPYLRSPSFVTNKMSNHIAKPNFRFLYERLKKIEDRNDKMVCKLRRKLLAPNLKTENDYFMLEKRLLKETGAANCDECADIIEFSLKERNIKNKTIGQKVTVNERYWSDEDPSKAHCFNLIGLKHGADVCKPKTWGNNAVIIDGWKNIYGKANDMLEYYKELFVISTKDTIEYSDCTDRFIKLIARRHNSSTLNKIIDFFKKNT